VPEVRSNWLLKIGTFFDGVLGNIGLAKGYVDPPKESFSDIPS
jgi:hypothetical protein